MAARTHSEAPVLAIDNLHKQFGGVHALAGVSLQLQRGEIVGLIGPNGAGKTALLNTITGFYRATSGSITFLGTAIDGLPLHAIGRLGIGRTFQNIRLFKRMSVLENVLVAQKDFATRPWHALTAWRARADASKRAMELLDLMQLTEQADRLAGALSYGNARRLEIARALAGAPRLLLLDEPAAGMNETETMQLIDDVRRVRAQLDGILLIEHDMELIRALSDQLVAMNYGRTVACGKPEEVLAHPEVRRAYLGEELPENNAAQEVPA